MAREVFLDTETTGFDYKIGNRIIEVGAVEVIDRKITGNTLHFYCNPNYEVEAGALAVHGLTNEFLADKPTFEEKAQEMIDFLKDSTVIIHNSAFDVPFINCELGLIKNNPWGILEDHVNKIIDSLAVARKKHPAQKNNLDSLCKRYFIKNDHRKFHGALLDSELLSEVYLAMTGGQVKMSLSHNANNISKSGSKLKDSTNYNIKKIVSNEDINLEHQKYLKDILKLENSW